MINQTILKRAEKLVADSSVPPHLIGFTFLSEAVVLKKERSIIKLNEIYSTIAQKYNSNHYAVTRSISYAISQAEHLRKYLSLSKYEITFNGKIISALALRLKSEDHEQE